MICFRLSINMLTAGKGSGLLIYFVTGDFYADALDEKTFLSHSIKSDMYAAGNQKVYFILETTKPTVTNCGKLFNQNSDHYLVWA